MSDGRLCDLCRRMGVNGNCDGCRVVRLSARVAVLEEALREALDGWDELWKRRDRNDLAAVVRLRALASKGRHE